MKLILIQAIRIPPLRLIIQLFAACTSKQIMPSNFVCSLFLKWQQCCVLSCSNGTETRHVH